MDTDKSGLPAAMAPSVIEEIVEKAKKPKAKNDPGLVAAAWELKDRWLERLNSPPRFADGKYEVSRAIEAEQSNMCIKQVAGAAPARAAPIAARAETMSPSVAS